MKEQSRQAVALNFSWLEEDRVAGCRGPRTDTDVAFLASVGIRALVRLASEAETGLSVSDLERFNIEDYYEPVPDWTAPSQEQIDRIVEFIGRTVANGDAVAVSCGAGCGRTGTILGSYLISRGWPAQAAIDRLTSIRPCSREILSVPGQREALFEFDRRRQSGFGGAI